MSEKKSKKRYSVQLTFLGIFFVFIALSIGLLNTYPTVSARDIVFSSKQEGMQNQIYFMSSSLGGLEELGSQSVNQIMSLVDVSEFDRVLITDNKAQILYDSSKQSRLGATALFPEVLDALGGDAVFGSSYSGNSFVSRAAAPVMSYGNVIGCVYVSQNDTQQAQLVSAIQRRLANISAIAGIVVLIIIVFFTSALTRRIRELVGAVRNVHEGGYGYRIEPKGNDEITELAVEFNDMSKRLQETEELRRRFVSDASHELRTPLASIRLLSDSIVQSENMGESTMREFVTDIGSEAERLQRLTEKLMMLTKLDSGYIQKLERVDIAPIAESTVRLLIPLAEERQVSIIKELEENCIINAVEDSIYQIIFNLAENAVKYNVQGGKVYIKLMKEDSEAVLKVEDTGIGIPEDDVKHIFSRFYRVDKARSREAGGSGLGLSIVHDAVNSFGGRISVHPGEKSGSCFEVRFPLAEEEAAHV